MIKKYSLEQYLKYTLLFLCCTFYFFWLPLNKLSGVSFALLIVFSLIYVFLYDRSLLLNKVIVLSFIAVVYLYFSTWFRISILEEFARFKYSEILASFFVFIFIGLVMSLRENYKNIVFLSLVLGVLFYLALNFDAKELIRAFNGVRVDFDIRNAQHTGVVFLLIAFICLFIIEVKSKFVAITFFMLFFILMLFAQVRAIILGLVFSGFIYVLLAILYKKRTKIIQAFLFLLVVSVLIFSFQKDNVVNRMSSQSSDLQALSLYLDGKNTRLTSSVIRVRSWEVGLDWFLEKPLLGHGAGALQRLIENNNMFKNAFKGKFGHLHNSYLEILIAYGLVGFLFYFSIIVILIWDFIKKLNSQDLELLENKKFLFFIFFIPAWLVANFFESYFFYSSGVYINSLFFGYLFYINYLEDGDAPYER